MIDRWFGKGVWHHTLRGLALILCSILYMVCDDHTDKIITSMMSILAIDSFTRKKDNEEK
jgi:hypothetical protein